MTKNRRHVDPIDDFVHEVALLRQRILDLERNTHRHGSGGSGSIAVGTIASFGVVTLPAGWEPCDGSAISRTDYADLFAVIGTTYGVGDGSTTFNLPNFGGRFPVGYDSGEPLWDAVGDTGGSRDAYVVSHTHTMGTHIHTMPTHTHTINHNHPAADSGSQSASHTHTTSVDHDHASVTSGSDSHNHGLRSSTSIGTGAFNKTNTAAGTLFTNDTHSHSVDLPNYNVSNRTSTSQSASHTHSVNLPSFTGTSGSTDPGDTNATDPGDTNSTGSSATDGRLPPYIATRFMIYAATA
jgi:microcystin-dependent protein